MKQRALHRPDDTALAQTVDNLLLRLIWSDEESDLRRRTLRQHFTKLTQLEQSDRRVAREVLLCLRCQRHKPRVMMGKVSEVRGGLGLHAAG